VLYFMVTADAQIRLTAKYHSEKGMEFAHRGLLRCLSYGTPPHCSLSISVC
jgi:aspartyl-tRNA synthetase